MFFFASFSSERTPVLKLVWKSVIIRIPVAKTHDALSIHGAIIEIKIVGISQIIHMLMMGYSKNMDSGRLRWVDSDALQSSTVHSTTVHGLSNTHAHWRDGWLSS
jgi:hypothetical protein